VATFLLSGLWHGASWHFVVWGGLNGLVVALTPRRRSELAPGAARTARVLATFLLVCLLWIPFRAESLGDARFIVATIVGESFRADGYARLWRVLAADPLTLWATAATAAFAAAEWRTRRASYPLEPLARLPRFARLAF
jgi:D-alanyl-lipoteichoic acid acyltransferase DltB (MBOAT superfamily)